MVGLGTLLSLFTQWVPFVADTPELARPPAFNGFELTHVVGPDHVAFALNAAPESSEARLAASAMLQARPQRVPRFKFHDSVDSVERSWRAGIERKQFGSTQITAAGNPDVPLDRENADQWAVETVWVPDVTDRETVLTLAKLAANAYVPTPFEGDWSDVNGTDGWDHESGGYGWEDDTLRGYVFTTEDRSAMVLSIKGTSTAVWDSGGPTAPNDKINDNLFFSCCCARLSRMWSTVCDCFMGDSQCDEGCLEQELWREDRYYRQVLDVYADARRLVPEANTVWITGHSLGGALSSMLGRTFGHPVVTFEAPGEDLPIHRLHLPVPPGLPPWEEYVWHFGHNADPIFMGTCSGSSSTCSVKGFAMETKCHSGQVCMYDVKADLGWHESIANHRIHVVIDNVLEVYDEPARCLTPEFCEDCIDWDFIDPYVDPEPSISEPAPSSSTSTSSSDVAKPTTTSSKDAKPSPEPTTTEYTSSCLEHNWYGRCTAWTTEPVTPTSSCVDRNWLGQCELWTTVYLPAATAPVVAVKPSIVEARATAAPTQRPDHIAPAATLE